ncbi:MAG: bifunctional metallophosphatase/5'-nucleotidase [Bacteroidetes bacterium]|nr:MAG: bifunctional metallophosphatase/5'-nucleotidase [Bacteroidota bacterium]
MKPTGSQTIFLLALLLLAFGCARKQDTMHVRLIATADVHAAVFPHDFVNDAPMNGSLAHVKTYLDQQRAIRGQHVVFLDNADLLQGQPTGYYFNFVADRETHFFADVLNYMQADAASVGNHDIEMGPEVYERLKNEFNFPWLAANILDINTGMPFFEPYTIIEKEGVKIAVLGLVTSSVPNWLPRKLWENLEFTSMYEAAVEWMAYIRDNEQPHAIIGLFHSGAGDADHYEGVAATDNASLFVGKNVPGFDVIFTAHDHRERNQYIENAQGEKVLIIAGQPFARSLGVVDLHFEKSADGTFVLSSKEGQIVEMSDYEPSPGMMSKFEKELQQVTAFVNQSLGELETHLHSREAFKGNAAFVDFIHQIQLDLTGAQVSLAAPLSFDAVLEAGELTMRDMFRLYPFENYLYVMELTGLEIKNALEYSYGLWFNTMEDADDHLMLLRRDEQGMVAKDQNNRARFANAFYNLDSALGINYTVDVTQPAGQRISVTSLSNGERFNLRARYKVAINSYRGSGGGGHLTHGAGIEHSDLSDRIRWVSEKDLRAHIADYIKTQGVLNPVAGNNWKVVPEEWTATAAERDFKLLFP